MLLGLTVLDATLRVGLIPHAGIWMPWAARRKLRQLRVLDPNLARVVEIEVDGLADTQIA